MIKAELTPREREVFELIGQGFSHKVVAIQLGVTTESVGAYASRLAQKLHGIGSPSVKIVRAYTRLSQQRQQES